MYGVMGVGGMWLGRPLMRESHFFTVGDMAILARASFCDMERRRLCEEPLMMGEADVMVEFS